VAGAKGVKGRREEVRHGGDREGRSGLYGICMGIGL
jgi:hypothetical protein